MIGYLSGSVKHISSQNCIILVNGVGYEVTVPARTLQKLVLDTQTELYIYTHVREDQLKLYGFESLLERDLFIALTSVSGVGPKTGILILSVGNVSDIQKAIIEANVGFFTQIKGLGKKNAQKLIIELKNKLGSINELDLQDKKATYSEDVIDALVSFGFTKRDIYLALEKLDTSLPEPTIIKLALQQLGK